MQMLFWSPADTEDGVKSATEVRYYTLGWAENILKELLNLVDVRLDLAVEGDEGRVRARRQVLEVSGLPAREVQ